MNSRRLSLAGIVALLVAVAAGAGEPVAPAPVSAAAPASDALPVVAETPSVASVAPATPAATTPLISQDTLLERAARQDPELFVLDVRRPDEYAAGHVPGAVNIPHDQLRSRLAEVPRNKDVVLYCHSGRRAGIAASVLEASGYERLLHLEGDMAAWQANALPIVKP